MGAGARVALALASCGVLPWASSLGEYDTSPSAESVSVVAAAHAYFCRGQLTCGAHVRRASINILLDCLVVDAVCAGTDVMGV